jgi:hypothetical protein
MRVQVRAHRRLETRRAFDLALEGDAGPVIDLVEFDLADVAEYDDATGEQRLSIDVPIAADNVEFAALDLLEPGVYPITVQLRRDSLLVASHTTFLELVRSGPGRGPFTFTIVANVVDPGPDATPSELDDAFEQLADIATLAQQVSAPIAIAVPPGLLAAANDDRPELLVALNASLTSDDRALVLPEPAFDPSSAADVELGDDFLDRMDRGAEQLTDLLPSVTVSTAAWPVTDRLTSEGAGLLQANGVALLLVPFERYASWDGSLPNLTDTTLLIGAVAGDDSTVRLLVTDRATRVLEPSAGEATPVERAVELMAATSTSRLELGPALRSFMLSTPELEIPDPAVLHYIERFAAEHPDYAFATPEVVVQSTTTNSFFVGGTEFTVGLDERPSQSIDTRALDVGATRLRMADVESMLPLDDLRPAKWADSMRTALSTSVSDAAAAERIDAVEAELAEVRAAIQQPQPFSFTLAGSESSIPFRIENRGPTPLQITVRAQAEQLTFPEDEVTAVLAPNATTDVPIPVIARSNGVFPVQVAMFTPAGNALLEPVSLTARVNSLTGLGRVVTVGAALVLASWWLSYLRRRRRSSRTAALAAALDRHPAANGDTSTTTDDAGAEHEFVAEHSPDTAEAAIPPRSDPTAAKMPDDGTEPPADRPGEPPGDVQHEPGL